MTIEYTDGIYKKYLVLKIDDIFNYLDDIQKERLKYIIDDINYKRHNDGKKDNDYLVINRDEKYAEIVKNLILHNEIRIKF